MKKKVVLILAMALGFAWNCHAQGWTYVQASLTTAGGNCTGGSSSCTIGPGNLIPTTAGTVWILFAKTGNGATISSVSGGGGSWASANAHVSNGAIGLDVWYNLTGVAGTSQMTVNLSTAASGFFQVILYEFLPPPGSTAALDTSSTASRTSCTICSAAALSLSATDAVLQVQAGGSVAGWNAWSSPYVTDARGDGVYLNAPGGSLAAPTMATTASSNSANVIFAAVAFKSSAGSFSPPAKPISVSNYGYAQPSCNPTCSLTIPSTGSGHLLYLQAGDITGSYISSVSGGGTWVVPSGTNTCRIALSSNALSCGYVLSSIPGATSINITMTGSGAVAFAVWEVATTSGSFALDAQGSTTDSPSFNPSGPALTLSGASHVIFQAIFAPGGISAVSLYPLPYINGQGTMFFNNEAAQAALLNTTDGAPPRWAFGVDASSAVSGIAFRTGTAPAAPTALSAVVN